MAGPLMSAPVAAQQIAQTKLQDQAQQQSTKQVASKFDGVMANKAQAPQAPGQVNATKQVDAAQATQKAQATQATQKAQSTSAAERIDHSRHVEQANRTERAGTRGVNGAIKSEAGAAPRGLEIATQHVDSPQASNQITGLLSDIEKGQGLMDKLINGGLSGKSFSNSELLALQAGMYKYTQELELTGKVVEKATTGLKDTLKTQV